MNADQSAGKRSLKRNRRVSVALIGIGVMLIFLSLFLVRSGRGQTTAPKESAVKPTIKVLPKTDPSRPDTATSTFDEAILKNTAFRNELSWTFGGKQQRGWYLYDLLIRRTLDTPDEFDTADFAFALSTWQKRGRLNSSGILDEESLMAMVSQWQSNRLKDKTPARPDQLVTAPSSDLYDPDRVAELRQVERDTYAAYKRMISAAINDRSLNLAHSSYTELAPTEKYFKIVSSFRSSEYQEELRRRSPNAGTAGLAVNSPHFTGRALDLYVGGDPVDTKDTNRAIQVNSPAYRWLVRNAERFGFRPYFYEPWHWEYVR
jgi:uncharacterized protein YcbK (DUF882 family)